MKTFYHLDSRPRSEGDYVIASTRPAIFVSIIWVVLMLLLVLGARDVAAQNVFTVNTLTDTDDAACNNSHCSLREAINASNATALVNGLPNRIVFSVTGLITLTAHLPAISQSVHVDGSAFLTSQGLPSIRVDGATLRTIFIIRASNCTIEGLAISRSSANGIHIDGTNQDANNNRILRNVIGLNEDGVTSNGNAFSGVLIESNGFNARDNIIGGGSASNRNIISGNSREGVRILQTGKTAAGNEVTGNYIGTDWTGFLDRGNTEEGISIESGASGNAVSGNVISGNNFDGILINTSPDNIVQENIIGLNKLASGPLANGGEGIEITGAASTGNIIGTGTAKTAGSPNVISGNTSHGVLIGGGSSSNIVDNNHIGTDASGTVAIGNGGDGVRIEAASTNHTIADNLISGNASDGVQIDASSSNIVQRNRIGTSAALMNSGNGVAISGASLDNLIGGENSADGNTISYNNIDGVNIATAATGNAVIGNAIFLNKEMGIDLGTNGIDANDGSDVDSGANNLQNYPILTSVTGSGGSTTVTGSINSKANTRYRIELFSNSFAETLGHGEGEVFLTSTTVKTDAGGNAQFTMNVGSSLTGKFVTATATELDGALRPKSTSEFSWALGVNGTTLTVNSTANTDDGSCDPLPLNCTLREAINAANNTPGIAESIAFAIPGSAPFRIEVSQGSGALPPIIDPVVIDGKTQSGFVDKPVIILDGNTLTADGLLVSVGGAGSTIRGLIISNFSGDGIQLDGDGVTVECVWLGLDDDGRTGIGNSENGIEINSDNNIIGGTSTSQRVVVADSGIDGIYIASGATGNQVLGSYIGLDYTGTKTTDLAGNSIANMDDGIEIESGSTDNVIGGTASGARNIVSNSGDSGISLEGDDNTVLGNCIGTNAACDEDLGNAGDGIEITTTGNDNLIGGSSSAAANVIAGSGSAAIAALLGQAAVIADGIAVSGPDNVIRGNYIGTNSGGVLDLGSSGHGIHIDNALAIGNQIGGTSAGDGNVIAFNNQDGVAVTDNSADANSILRNSIYSNDGLGIDLSDNSVTMNDSDDPDTGPNQGQNFPVINSAAVSSGSTVISASLNSLSANTYRVEFFASPTADPTGYGEGKMYLGSTQVLLNTGTTTSFTATVDGTTSGYYITATATDITGTGSAVNNTSEFSKAVQATGTSTPALTQTCTLLPGWDWFSINVNPSNQLASAVLSGLTLTAANNGDIVAFDGSPTWMATYLHPNWIVSPTGSLLVPGNGYKAKLSTSSTFTVTGTAAVGSISLGSGVTWFGFNSQSSKPISSYIPNAVSLFALGDKVASQTGFDEWQNPWLLDMTLQPCEGYRSIISAGTGGSFTPPAKNSNNADGSWTVDPSRFHSSMYVIGGLSNEQFGAPGDEDLLIAMVGEETRGVAAPVSAGDARIFLLTVFANENGEDVRFRFFDKESDTVTELEGGFTFEDGKVNGTAEKPVVWHTASSTATHSDELPIQYALQQNYPNPFNPETSIRYMLPENATVSLRIFDLQGRVVSNLVEGAQSAGVHEVTWNGRDMEGQQVASGVYLYRLEAGPFVKVQKMVLMK